jgi:hypothetical protein
MLSYTLPTSDALIEREYTVGKPNGEAVRVNRFDFNLASCADKDSYIQCSDQSWMRVRNLTGASEDTR